MKNRFCNNLILFLAVSFFFCFSSCDLEVESPLEKSLDIEESQKGFTIALTPISDYTDYINIFRKDSSGKIVNIGLVYPEAELVNNVYVFEDTYLLKGEKYSYQARYHTTKGEYKKSAWSTELEAKNGIETEALNPFNYGLENTKIIYDKIYNTLTLKGDWTLPQNLSDFDNFDTALVLSIPSKKITQAIQIQKIDSSNISEISSGKEIKLKDIIPESFYDVNFTVDGLMLFKKETVSASENKLRKVYCTEIASFLDFPIYDAETDTQLESKELNVSLKYGEAGFDCSTY